MDPLAIVSTLSGKAGRNKTLLGTPKSNHKKRNEPQLRPNVSVELKKSGSSPLRNESNGIGGKLPDFVLYFVFSTDTFMFLSTLGINLFDLEANDNNAVVTGAESSSRTVPVSSSSSSGGQSGEQRMDLIFSSGGGSTQQHTKYQQHPKPSSGMAVDALRGPGRELLRSISSVATSPVSHLPGGGGDEKMTVAQLPKMSKKELKLAQNQLNKLTQINIHLHGKKRRSGVVVEG